MSRKNKPERNPLPDSAPSTFAVGNRVRVRKGVTDPDYPDIPLGGWTGTVLETYEQDENGRSVLVEWDESALRQMHPVYRYRCERDGLDIDSITLGEGDLELNVGEAVPLEQPATLQPRPLDLGDQNDRIRAVFKLTSDEPLPAPTLDWLARYHSYFLEHVRFPLDAEYAKMNAYTPGAEEEVRFLALLPMEQVRVENGLLAEIERPNGERSTVELFDLETPRNPYVRQLIGDYSYWFVEAFRYHLVEGGGRKTIRLDGTGEATASWSIVSLLVRWGAYGTLCGAVVGAITAAVDGARAFLVVAASVTAVMGYFLGSWVGLLLRALRLGQAPRFYGSLFGAFIGAVVGAIVGPALAAFQGTILGGIAGFIVGHSLAKLGLKRPGGFISGLLGAGTGGVALACSRDADRATVGLLIGAGVGAVVGVVLMLMMLFTMALFEGKPDDRK